MRLYLIWFAIWVGASLAIIINLPFKPYFWYWLIVFYIGFFILVGFNYFKKE